jgi:CrcB protein
VALVGALSVGAGGAAGALARYAVGRRIERGLLGTLVVNVLGSFLLGIVLTVDIPEGPSMAVSVGFCGAFTTFSSFAVETVLLAEDGDHVAATLNAGGTLLLAIAAVVAGIAVGGLL